LISPRRSRRSVERTALVNAVVPAAVFLVASRGAHLPQTGALALAAVVPACVAVAGIVRRRTLDPIATIVLFGLGITAIAVALGASPRFFLIRESFVSLGLAIACVASFALPRPLLFYVARSLAARGDLRARTAFDARWERPRFRTATRLITAVWGLTFAAEFVVRLMLAYTFPIAVVLAIGPIVSATIVLVALGWTYEYVRRQRAQADADD
jgi:hypothetical protein